METKKVWFVTGASKGLGLSLVNELLAQDYHVVATSRNQPTLVEAIGSHDNFLPLEMDITNDSDVAKAVQTAVDSFGKIDVVVNNAGYSQIGTLEELTDEETRRNYDVNVFGSLNVIRHTAPHLRQQQSGHIFNIASIGGLVGSFPAFGIYCSTKFAVAGFTEALAVEMEPFGVHTTLVYPGYFRTDFLSKGSVQTPANPIDAYTAARASEAAHLNQINGNQPNDPQKAAELFIQLSKLDHPPVHFVMGEDAYGMVQDKIQLLSQESEKWKAYSLSTGY
ncbi:SDR family NAD(P)-dependent oxidoreductase [Sphingobacterium olei]|uniref:SDR family NAD(P)-dependent oxidoreductase n=1 Tax=Sphingobacterium olei TaxID=2571155 RepID=A0A4V5MN18_9SPHI|nr:SDR family NAD(P)-dependent oxidoreductase [Sphingobacterium olei]TJZ63038.1 SDR family NAD(P)-dependent oxidoreductase [Sphingobacterium olei]